MLDRFGQDRGTAGGETEAFPAAGGDVSVGDLLRTERQRRGWTLADAEIYLKIRRSILDAIEQGRYELLPGKAYALAFCRTYAEFLGLDAEDIVRRCREELRHLGEPKAKPSRGVAGFNFDLSRIFMVAAATAGVVVAGLWMFGGDSAPVERPADVARQQILPPRDAAQADAARAPGQPAGGAVAALPTPSPIAAQAAPSQPAASDPLAALAAAPAASAAPPAPAPTVVARAAPAEPPPPPAPRITIRANGDTWVEIRDAAGVSVLARTLRNGETYQVPDRNGLVLTSGRMNSLEVRVDGQVVPPQGRQARRELQLDPARLLQAAQAPAEPAAQRGQQQRRGNAPAGGATNN